MRESGVRMERSKFCVSDAGQTAQGYTQPTSAVGLGLMIYTQHLAFIAPSTRFISPSSVCVCFTHEATLYRRTSGRRSKHANITATRSTRGELQRRPLDRTADAPPEQDAASTPRQRSGTVLDASPYLTHAVGEIWFCGATLLGQCPPYSGKRSRSSGSGTSSVVGSSVTPAMDDSVV